MSKSRRFERYSDVEEHLSRLKHHRREGQHAMELYWEAIKDHETRGRLLKDALHDAFRAWKPAQAVSSLFAGNGTSVGTTIAAQALTGRGSIKRRLFWAVLSAAAPALVGMAVRGVGRFMRERAPDGPDGEEIIDR